MIPYEWLEQAEKRIAGHVHRTPLTYDGALEAYLKWENRQVTGSFKVRGAFNRILMLEDWERQTGIVAASAGNHGQGVALAGQRAGAPVEVFVSEQAVRTKVDAMRALGAVIHPVPGGFAQAEAAGRSYAEARHKTWISPYNDGQVIAGQGTLGLELRRDLPDLDGTWLVPVSGGGLLAGVGASLNHARRSGDGLPGTRLVGVQAEVAPFMHGLYYHGTQDGIPDLPSLADGLTGAVEHGSVTIPMTKEYTDEILLVSEGEIVAAIAYAWKTHGQVVEGAGAVGLAAVLSGKVRERPVVVVISGGNLDPETHAEVLRISG